MTRVRAAWGAFFERHPRLRWARTWGVSVASLGTGLATVFVFRRGVEYFPLFIGYLLLVWLAGVVCVGARHTLAARGPRPVSIAIDYTIQTLLHGLFLFLLPLYYASTTFPSGNVWLFLVLAAAAVLTTIDPWYRAVLRRARWIEIALFWVGLFASLNAACPLVGVPGEWGLYASGSVSVLALLPAFHQALRLSWLRAGTRLALFAVLTVVCLWGVREWIPPAPLHVVRATFARAVERLEPLEPTARIPGERLRAWRRVAVFTAIAAPGGFAEPVYHVWYRNGRVLDTILLTTVRGGRRDGFRAYSWKADLGADPTGVWRVDVRTVHGQLIGRVQMVVTN